MFLPVTLSSVELLELLTVIGDKSVVWSSGKWGFEAGKWSFGAGIER